MTETNPPAAKPDAAQAAPSPRPPSSIDRFGKWIFLAAAVVIGLVVWWFSRGDVTLDWPENFDATMAQAKSESRKVVVLIVNSPQSDYDRFLIGKIIGKPGNQEAIKSANVLKVLQRGTDSPAARKYQADKLPALLLLGPDGRELARRQGDNSTGEIEFRQRFLKGLPPG